MDTNQEKKGSPAMVIQALVFWNNYLSKSGSQYGGVPGSLALPK
jgi:hypothetical protein